MTDVTLIIELQAHNVYLLQNKQIYGFFFKYLQQELTTFWHIHWKTVKSIPQAVFMWISFFILKYAIKLLCLKKSNTLFKISFFGSGILMAYSSPHWHPCGSRSTKTSVPYYKSTNRHSSSAIHRHYLPST